MRRSTFLHVYKMSKATWRRRHALYRVPLHLVYDASCKSETEISLNQCLETGENYVPELLKILLKLRLRKVSLIADIEKAFLQIRIQDNDKDLVRFLCDKNLSTGQEAITKYRMNRLLFGLTCSPFILAAVVRIHTAGYHDDWKDSAPTLTENLYVDDIVVSFDNEQEALHNYKKIKTIMAEGGSNMRKWKTNSRSVQMLIDKEEQQEQEFQKWDKEKSKVLGLKWNLKEDYFYFDSGNVPDKVLTKCKFFHAIAQIYDPMGLIAPVVVEAKIILQRL